MEWTDLSATSVVQGTMPSARAMHFMTAVGKDIDLFGGYFHDIGEEEEHLQAEVKGSRRSHLHMSPSVT